MSQLLITVGADLGSPSMKVVPRALRDSAALEGAPLGLLIHLEHCRTPGQLAAALAGLESMLQLESPLMFSKGSGLGFQLSAGRAPGRPVFPVESEST